jgi:hypothetical protein
LFCHVGAALLNKLLQEYLRQRRGLINICNQNPKRIWGITFAGKTLTLFIYNTTNTRLTLLAANTDLLARQRRSVKYRETEGTAPWQNRSA